MSVTLEFNSQTLATSTNAGGNVLWSGSPRQGMLLQSGDFIAIPFTVAIDALIFFFFYKIIRDGALNQMLFLIPFIAVGSFLTVGRYYWDSKRRAGTSYELTDTQIIIHKRRSFFTDPIRTYNLSSLPNVVLQKYDDGTGTLFLLDKFFDDSITSRVIQMSGWRRFFARRNIGDTNLEDFVTLDRIADADKVYNLIHKLQGAEA